MASLLADFSMHCHVGIEGEVLCRKISAILAAVSTVGCMRMNADTHVDGSTCKGDHGCNRKSYNMVVFSVPSQRTHL